MKTKTKQSEKNLAKSMQSELLVNAQDMNSILTSAKNVSPVFQAHWFDMTSGEHGLSNLICSILAEREAQFSKGVEKTALRPVAIAASMFVGEIIEEVQNRFTAGSTRYPYESIHQYLSVVMVKAGTIGKIKLNGATKTTTDEDPERKCCKPRTKIYLIK